MQSKIDYNRQDSDKKIKTSDSKPDKLMEVIENMMSQNQKSNSLPENMDSPKSQDTTTALPANKKYPSLEGGHYTNIGGMWTLKNEIISPKFYELLIKTKTKSDTDLNLKRFYNHI